MNCVRPSAEQPTKSTDLPSVVAESQLLTLSRARVLEFDHPLRLVYDRQVRAVVYSMAHTVRERDASSAAGNIRMFKDNAFLYARAKFD